MEILPGFSLPLWTIITAVSAAAALIILIIIKVYQNYSFQKRCEQAVKNPEEMSKFCSRYSGKKLLNRSRLVEKAADKTDVSLLSKTGLDSLWEKQFMVYRRQRFLRKFLCYFPEKGLFFCILAGRNRPAFEKLFTRTITQSSDLNLLKKIAASGDGKDFDGSYALQLIGDRFQDIIELTGDSEWQIRFFGIKMLMYSDDKRAERAVWEALSDSSHVIRQTVAAEFKPGDSKKMSARLKELLLDDPSYTVRKAARLRLDSDFPELYRIDINELSKPQIIHLLGLLHDGSDEDQNTALEYLQSGDLEIRLQAALYLQKQEVLKKMFLAIDAGDRSGYKRTEKLLKMACEVNCTKFLRELNHTENPASIKLAAVLLKKYGNRKYIDTLAKRIFAPSFRDRTKEHYTEIYTEAVDCISVRGSEPALEMLNREIREKHSDADIADILLPRLPVRGEAFFIPTLIGLLKEGDFPHPDILRETIERFPSSLYIEDLISILRSSPEQYSPGIKKEAFKILGELKLPCCLQMILENLKLLSKSEQKDFAAILTSYEEQAFADRAAGLLTSCDSGIKSALITSLPATGLKQFVKEVKEAAKDSDPEVRIASIWALAGYEETKLLSQMTDMLRDPIERVRRAAARVIANFGTPAALNELSNLLTDENEVLPVKTAAVFGFGKSERPESVGILVKTLEDAELRSSAIKALSEKTSKQSIKQLIELFKDAAPQLREYIAEVFKAMGESAEPAITELLQEDIASLREITAEILLKIGFIETTVAKLRNRKPETRKQAAAVLALIRTNEAFKGIVLAARDPDPDVRVEVLKALERLNTPAGKPLLDELLNDPDRRVRKYTLWAMERLKAKNTNE